MWINLFCLLFPWHFRLRSGVRKTEMEGRQKKSPTFTETRDLFHECAWREELRLRNDTRKIYYFFVFKISWKADGKTHLYVDFKAGRGTRLERLEPFTRDELFASDNLFKCKKNLECCFELFQMSMKPFVVGLKLNDFWFRLLPQPSSNPHPT